MSKQLGRGSWLVTVPLAASALAYMVFLYVPTRSVIAELEEQIATRQEYLAHVAPLSASAAFAQEELRGTLAHNRRWIQSSPAPGEMSHFYARIHELAGGAGAVITRFDPDKPVYHQLIRETPLSIGVTGTFADVFRFLQGVESLGEEVWVNYIVMEKPAGRQDSEGRVNLAVFSVNSDISDYVEHSD